MKFEISKTKFLTTIIPCSTKSLHLFLTLFFYLFVASIQQLHAQATFETTFGGSGEEVCSKTIYSNGKIYITGHTTSLGSGSYDVSFIMTDGSGNLTGNTIAGLSGEDIPLSATRTIDNEFILCGYTNSLGSEKPFAIKFDSTGNVVWSKYYSISGWGEDIASLNNGDFYLTGYISNPDYDVVLIKCNSTGNVIWAKSIGDSLINEGRKITVTEDDGAIITGITQVQAGGPSDIFVIKADKYGAVQWSKKYATADFYNWDNGYAVRTKGDQIIVGCLSYNQAFNNNPNSPDGLLLRLKKDGTLISATAFGSHEYEDIRDIDIMDDGRVCMTGATNYNTHGQTDLLFAIADSSGNIIAQKVFGGNSYDHGLSIQSITENDFLLGGYSESLGNGLSDIYLIRTDTSAISACNSITGSISSVSVIINEVTVFDTASLPVSAFQLNFNVLHQILPQNIFCSTTGISEYEIENKNLFFPNPFDDFTKLEFDLKTDAEIHLYNMLGIKLSTENRIKKTTGGISISGEGLVSGIYLCIIRQGGNFYINKIIKR